MDYVEEFPYTPADYNSPEDYHQSLAEWNQRREEERIFNEALKRDPTIKIHVWPTVVHPGYETRTAWLRPANAYTQTIFDALPMSGLPPHELIEQEHALKMDLPPYILSALLIDSPKSDEQDFPKHVEHLIRTTFQIKEGDNISLVVHTDVVALDRNMQRNKFGAE